MGLLLLSRHHFKLSLTFLLLASASGSAFASNPTRQFSLLLRRNNVKEKVGRAEGTIIEPKLTRRRWLIGPGSSPPTCRSKCESCSPCEPVHVPIQPGFSVTLEYYPEAWRCQCGNKLFMP